MENYFLTQYFAIDALAFLDFFTKWVGGGYYSRQTQKKHRAFKKTEILTGLVSLALDRLS